MIEQLPALRHFLVLMRLGLLCLAVTAGAHAASPAVADACSDGSKASGPTYSEAESRHLFERFICQMAIAAPAKPLEYAGAVERMEFAPAIDVGFQPLQGAVLVDVSGTMELVDTVNFNEPPKIDFSTFTNLAQPASLMVGESAVWMVTPGGVRVFDAKTARWSFSSQLSSDQVRPKDVLLDEKTGNAWFFGRDLYQYEIANHKIYRYKPASKLFRTIRKLAVVSGDIWLATDGGVFYFDTKRKVLAQLQATGKLPTQLFTQVAADKNGAWFGSGDAHLLRIQRNGPNLSAHISKPIGKLAPIELLARDNDLWMLYSQDQGRSYQLAAVALGNSQLLLTKKTFFNLRESDGQVLASAFDKIFRLDTNGRTLQPILADVANIGALTLGNRVMFSGASYVNSLSTGSVGRYVLDLSKGWQKPASRVLFEAWGVSQSAEMFGWSPALLETGANTREIWFLVAGNLTDALSDRSYVARYDKRTNRAQVFFSRWSQDANGSRPFAVDSLSTMLERRDQ